MNNMFNKYFISFTLFMSILISLTFSDLILIWFIMELNNFLFICILTNYMKNKKMIFFYFLIQMIPSIMLFFSFSLNYMIMFNNMIINIIYMNFFMKLGIPPLHFWMIIISNYLTWKLLFLLLTSQKIIPLYMTSIIPFNLTFLYLSLITCSIIPPIMMMKLLNFKKMMTYSSINQTMWMIMLMYTKNFLWMIYMMIYMLSLMLIIYMISLMKIYPNFLLNKMFYKSNKILMIMMMNIASLPPFSLFYIKWFMIFNFMKNSNFYFILILMIISSFIMLYIYLNMMSMSMFLYTYKTKLIMNLNKLFNKSFIFILLMYLSLWSSLMLLIM